MVIKRTGLLIRPDNTILRIEYTTKHDFPEITSVPQERLKTLLLGKRLCGFADPFDTTSPLNESASLIVRMTTGATYEGCVRGNMLICGREGENDLVDCPADIINAIMLNGVAHTILGQTPRYVEKLWVDILVRAFEKHDSYLDLNPNLRRLNVRVQAGKIVSLLGFF